MKDLKPCLEMKLSCSQAVPAKRQIWRRFKLNLKLNWEQSSSILNNFLQVFSARFIGENQGLKGLSDARMETGRVKRVGKGLVNEATSPMDLHLTGLKERTLSGEVGAEVVFVPGCCGEGPGGFEESYGELSPDRLPPPLVLLMFRFSQNGFGQSHQEFNCKYSLEPKYFGHEQPFTASSQSSQHL